LTELELTLLVRPFRHHPNCPQIPHHHCHEIMSLNN
jgi:hypothetical protein